MGEDVIRMEPKLWLPEQKLILASSSSIRRALLESASIPVDVANAGVDERKLESDVPDQEPRQTAILLAEAKAQCVAERYKAHVVVGADQILELHGRIFHKPRDSEEAIAQLGALSGHCHTLHSAVAVARHGRVVDSFCDSASMTVRPLNNDDIAIYFDLASAHGVLSSVGSYQFEKLGIHVFSDVRGHHSTILGLPMLQLLRSLGSMYLLKF